MSTIVRAAARRVSKQRLFITSSSSIPTTATTTSSQPLSARTGRLFSSQSPPSSPLSSSSSSSSLSTATSTNATTITNNSSSSSSSTITNKSTTTNSTTTTTTNSTTTSSPSSSSSSYLRRQYHGQSIRHGQQQNERLLVIGSGVAGSATALVAAEEYGIPVTLLFAGNQATDCNSYWAQGGIIYKGQASQDSPDLLASDIHRAGAGLCHDPAVQQVAHDGPGRVEQLLLRGGPYAQVPFDRDAGTERLSLCLEASHSAPRILHRADHTGRTITEHLVQAVRNHPLIECRHNTIVTDLLVDDSENACVGVQTINRTNGRPEAYGASRGVVLCAGGLGGIYQHSTNPAGFNALGSSVALAQRAGVRTADLEFVQFHPTALYVPNQPRFLLTEALRGEGAILRNAQGHAFCRDYHPSGELAPRDVVARAVFDQAQKTGQSVYLDITHRDGAWLHQRFPSIQAHLQQSQTNLDLARDWLPITPAAHYTCGGVSTDLQGRTSLTNLYAAGEAACTGLHGGNRLASTSLLEGLVFGAAVADAIGASSAAATSVTPPSTTTTTTADPYHIQTAADQSLRRLQRLRQTMWDHVGVTRTVAGLETAQDELEQVRQDMDHLHATCPTLETAAVRDAAYAGLAVAQAALANRASVGAHCIVDEEESDEDEVVLVASE